MVAARPENQHLGTQMQARVVLLRAEVATAAASVEQVTLQSENRKNKVERLN